MKLNNPTIEQTARLVALASILQIAEAFFPHPIPGVRLGLANVITLIALVRLGNGCALEIAVLRTVIGSLALGTFLTPTFIISFVAAIGSTGAMIFFHALLKRGAQKYFSIIGVSLVGAAGHNLIQILLAYLLIIRHQSIFLLAPWLGISAVLTGWLTGVIALHVCRKLAVVGEPRETPAAQGCVILGQPAPGEGTGPTICCHFCRPPRSGSGRRSCGRMTQQRTRRSALQTYIRGEGAAPSAPSALKIKALLLLALLVLFINSFTAFGLILLGLLAVSGLAGLSPITLLRGLARQWSLIFISFLMPVLFHTNGAILWIIGPLTITVEGLLLGAAFASRLGLLLLGAALLVKTTAPQDLARGIEQILRPLAFLGINAQRVSAVLALAWLALPALENKARGFLSLGRQAPGSRMRLMPGVIDFLAEVYQEAETKTGNNR